jgi:hypothetical protein
MYSEFTNPASLFWDILNPVGWHTAAIVEPAVQSRPADPIAQH